MFTYTVHGPGLKTVAQHLRTKERKLVNAVADAEYKAAKSYTPFDKGLLRRRLVMRVKGPTPSGGLFASVGPLYELPLWTRPPAGTIRAFVKWYISRFGRRPGGSPGKAAWVGMSRHAKEELLRLRRAGNTQMGGSYSPLHPLYFSAVDQGRVPGVSNRNARFSQRIIENIVDAIDKLVQTVFNWGKP